MDLKQIAHEILAGEHKSLGKGTFGTVFHINQYIVKKINIEVKEDMPDFVASKRSTP